MAPAVVDPLLIKKLSDILLPKSPIHLPYLSSHPQKKALVPLIGLETASLRMAKMIMPSKGVPFSIDDWPSVVIQGLTTLNANNWFPAMTLIVGNPDETDEDVKATLDLIYEVERRGLFAFFIPSIFTRVVDVQASQAERPELQVALADVFERNVREDDGADGQDLHRQAGQVEVSQRADFRAQATLPAIPSRRQRRLAGWLCAASSADWTKSCSGFTGSFVNVRSLRLCESWRPLRELVVAYIQPEKPW
jgi:hypothetical protein